MDQKQTELSEEQERLLLDASEQDINRRSRRYNAKIAIILSSADICVWISLFTLSRCLVDVGDPVKKYLSLIQLPLVILRAICCVYSNFLMKNMRISIGIVAFTSLLFFGAFLVPDFIVPLASGQQSGGELLLLNSFTLSSILFGLLQCVLLLMNWRYAQQASNEEERNDETKKKAAVIMWLSKNYLWPNKLFIFTGLVALIGTTAAGLSIPYFTGSLVDILAAESDKEKILSRVLSIVTNLIGILIFSALMQLIRGYSFIYCGQLVVKQLRRDIFNSIIRRDMTFFDSAKVGELTSLLSSDAQIIQTAVSDKLAWLIRFVVQICGSLALMLYTSWQLTLIVLVVVPLVLGVALFVGRRLKMLQKEFQDKLASASSVADEALGNIQTVKIFANELWAVRSFTALVEEMFSVGVSMAKVGGLFGACVNLLAQSAILLVIYFGATLVVAGHLTAGRLTSFLIYTITTAASFAILATLFGEFMQALGAADRICSICSETTLNEQEESSVVEIKDFEGAVDIEQLWFHYPTRPNVWALKGVSLQLRPNRFIALCGPSGGGKSTIVRLLEGMYKCDSASADFNSKQQRSGSIRIDGIDIGQVNMQWFKRQIGYVPQNPLLFSMSVRDNIAFASLSSSLENDEVMQRVLQVARMANAHEFIMQLPDGYDTVVGERGSMLSGGQVQRIAIARALFLDPRILLLDEATSSLDSENESIVQQALSTAMSGRSVLCIAHRLSTIRSADEVIVLQDGCVVERGTHKQLLSDDNSGNSSSNSGVYRRLVEQQMLSI